jgi:hypothetical protein
MILIGVVLLWLVHDPARPELNGWFLGLSSAKGPCCDGSEATRLDDVDWASVTDTTKPDVHYKARVQGEWIDVPDSAVVEGPNRAGPAMLWPYFKDGHPQARCFLPGSMT